MKLLGDEDLQGLGLRLGDRVLLRDLCAEAARSEGMQLVVWLRVGIHLVLCMGVTMAGTVAAIACAAALLHFRGGMCHFPFLAPLQYCGIVYGGHEWRHACACDAIS